MKFRGRVVRAPFGVGSKSERQAIWLETDDDRYVLRRKGANAFSDPQLDKLVGCELEVEGKVVGRTLLMTSWKIDPPPP